LTTNFLRFIADLIEMFESPTPPPPGETCPWCRRREWLSPIQVAQSNTVDTS
jgi:hypothetical protein